MMIEVFTQQNSGTINRSWGLDGRTGFVEKGEFGFDHLCFVALEGHPDIWMEDYNVGLSSWSKNWEQSMWK